MQRSILRSFVFFFLFASTVSLLTEASPPRIGNKISVLIVDGQNNHQWQICTSVLEAILRNSGYFEVEVATTPPTEEGMEEFRPDFSRYQVVLSNYNGSSWAPETRDDFESYVSSGGGFVVFHAADNAFPEWEEYNRMIGLGGWGGRDETSGPYIRWRDGRIVRDESPGRGGSHGRRHEFVVRNRAPEHPVMKGLPTAWLHSRDELYDRLRGPAQDLEVLATAYSDPETGGSGEHEPVLMTIRYGAGRVFHTVLGDNMLPMFNVGFQSTLLRGTEWAATGSVTIPAPPLFPSEGKVVTADPFTPYPEEQFGWKPLFNGKDLTGWEQVNGTASYEVLRDEGVIVGTTAEGSPNSFLATQGEYGDFELRFEVKLDDEELNSGVQIRSDQYGEGVTYEWRGETRTRPVGRVYGYQVEIEASRDPEHPNEAFGDAGFIYDEARRGWLSTEEDRSDPLRRSLFKNGHWNQYQIRCQGDRIQTWINGVEVASLEDAMTSTGRIMLQVHSIPEGEGPWSVRWRNIFVRELK